MHNGSRRQNDVGMGRSAVFASRIFAVLLVAVGCALTALAAAMACRLGASVAITDNGRLLLGGACAFLGFCPPVYGIISSVSFRTGHYGRGFLAASFVSATLLFSASNIVGFVLTELDASSRATVTCSPRQPFESRQPGEDETRWRQGTSVTPGRAERGGRQRDSQRSTQPAITTAPETGPSCRSAELLATALGSGVANFELAMAIALGLVLEIARLACFILAAAIWPTRSRVLMADPPKAQPAEPAMSNSDAGHNDPGHAPCSRRARVPKTDRAGGLLHVLEQALATDTKGLQVCEDGRLFCSQRVLADLIGCGPSSLNAALHRLEDIGLVSLFPTPRGTFIRVLRPP